MELEKPKRVQRGMGGGNGKRTHSQNATRHLWTRYQITHEQWMEMLNRQNGKCAICGAGVEEKRLCVDHCHETGRVRGLLCHHCNHGIGFLEKPEWLDRAEEYLG